MGNDDKFDEFMQWIAAGVKELKPGPDCPPEALLFDWVHDKLDAHDAQTVSRHVEDCAYCMAMKLRLRGDAAEWENLTEEGMASVGKQAFQDLDVPGNAQWSGRSPETVKPGIRSTTGLYDRLAGWFKSAFSVPAFAMAVCAIIAVGVLFRLQPGTPDMTVTVGLVDDIGFPLIVRGTDTATDQAHWFFLKAKPNELLAIHDQPEPEAARSLIRSIRTGERPIIALYDDTQTLEEVDALFTRWEEREDDGKTLSIVFEKRFLKQLKAADPDTVLVACVAVSEPSDGMEIRFGQYNRWIHGDVDAR